MTYQTRVQRPGVPERGQLSSGELNEFFTQVTEDIVGLTSEVNGQGVSRLASERRLKDELTSLRAELAMYADQLEARKRAYAQTNVRIDEAISAYDLSKLRFPDGSAANVRASVSTTYGQATIPMNGAEQKFFTLDFRNGEVVTSDDLNAEVLSTFDKGGGDGLVDYSYGGAITRGDTTLAFNGVNTDVWVEQVAFDLYSDVDSVEAQLTVQVPSQTNVQANVLTVHPHPWKDIDITDVAVSSSLGGAFTSVSGFEATNGAENLRLFFPTQQISQVRIRLRARNWREINGKKVFRYGLEELGLLLVNWDKTWDSAKAITANHTLAYELTAPAGYNFNGLTLFSSIPDFTLENAGSRHLHFKIASDTEGANVLWDSDANTLPQSQNTPIDLGGTNSTLYLLATMNWVENSGGGSSPFEVGTPPYLNFVQLGYSVVSQ